MAEFLLGSVVECEEGLFFLADEHKAVVLITFNIGGEFDVGDEEVVVLILHCGIDTCSYLVLNHSLALPYLTGIIIKYVVSITKFYFTTKLTTSTQRKEDGGSEKRSIAYEDWLGRRQGEERDRLASFHLSRCMIFF